MTAAVAQPLARVEVSLPSSPYRGLDPFTDSEREYFFGREAETMTFAANLLTAPVTVLYGASGVGKSSLLMAGVAPFVGSQKNTTLVLFRSWQQPDLIRALNHAVAEAVRQKTAEPVDESQGFDVCVASAVKATQGTIAVIFDQFEEFLEHHAMKTDAGDTFDRQFARLANRNDAPVNFLLAIREDCAAKLDRFQRHIPHLMTNLIRLEHLDLDGARNAILKPLERYNAALRQRDPDTARYGIEGALVDEILEQVKIASRIETPFLQMILEAVWNEERSQGSRTLRLETLSKLGGAKRIVHNYVEGVVQKLSPYLQEVCARMFDRLVTPSGMKITHSAADLQDMVEEECRGGVLQAVKALSVDSRILREVDSPTDVKRYEIFHDVLSKPIVEWRSGYQALKRERYRARMTRRRMVAFLIVAAIVAIGAVWNNVDSKNRKAIRERAKALVAQAGAAVASGHPEVAAAKVAEARPLYEMLNDKTGPTVFEGITASLTEAARNNPAKAAEYYEAAASMLPQPRRKVWPLLSAARARIDRGDLSGARRTLAEVESHLKDQKWTRFELQLGQALIAARAPEKAKPILEAVTTRSGADRATAADAHLALAEIYGGSAGLESLAKALQFYTSERPQEHARALMMSAAIHRKMGNTAAAEAASAGAVTAMQRVVRGASEVPAPVVHPRPTRPHPDTEIYKIEGRDLAAADSPK